VSRRYIYCGHATQIQSCIFGYQAILLKTG
jgi:hypothetical protein